MRGQEMSSHRRFPAPLTLMAHLPVFPRPWPSGGAAFSPITQLPLQVYWTSVHVES